MDKAGIIKEAQRFLVKGQIDKAIQEFEKLLDSGDGNLYNTLGDLYLKKNDTKRAVEIYHRAARIFRDNGFYDKAKALYRKLLNINPSDYSATIALGEIAEEKGLATDAIKYYLSAVDLLAKTKDRDELVKVCKRIIDLQPSNLPMRIKFADLFLKEGLSEEAARQYDIIARLSYDSGDLQKAKEYYQKVLSINPSDRTANLGLSEVYQKEGNYKEAIESLKRVVSSSPEDKELLSKYIKLLAMSGDRRGVMEELRRLIEADPSNLTAKKELASLYLQEGQKEEAWSLVSSSLDELISFDRNGIISVLEELRDVEPVESSKRLAIIYKDTGDHDKAFEEFVKLGDYYLNSGLTEEALNCYREAQQLRPDDPYLRTKLLEIEMPFEEVREEGKPIEQILQEADIYLKFGLYEEAKKRLEPLKAEYPYNPELHLKLKQLYLETGDTEMAVTECLALSEIYRREGRPDEAESFIKEARSINPDDPRLKNMELEEVVTHPEAPPSKEEYSEAFVEADFYEKQGLIDEALKVYKNLQSIFPDDEEIVRKIKELESKQLEVVEISSVPEPGEVQIPQEESVVEPEELREVLPPLIEPSEPEPELSDSVAEIFEEFKRGLEEQVKEEDSETHYNLGIAYKEMGLLNDAIKEFQLARRDPAFYLPSMSMLALCYKEKGLYKLAIDTLEEALKGLDKSQEEYLAMKYELADAYEKNGDLAEAFNIYTEIYGMDSSFRDVSRKIETLKNIPSRPKRPSITPLESEQLQKKKKDRISYI